MTDYRELYNFREWVLNVCEVDNTMINIDYWIKRYLRETQNIHTMVDCLKCGNTIPFDKLVCDNPCEENV